MRNNNSLQEIAEINCLLSNIKKEYEEGIRPVLSNNNPLMYGNPHKIPRLKKIKINRGLGLAAQNTNILKKSIEEELKSVDDQLSNMRENQTEAQSMVKELTSKLNDLMAESLDNSEKMYNRQMEKFEGVLDSLNLGADNILESTQKVGLQVEEMMKDFANEQKNSAQEIKRRIDETLADNTETLNQSFQALDQGMQEQLQRSLDKMGNNLASITDKFVDTYEKSASRITELTSRITNQ